MDLGPDDVLVVRLWRWDAEKLRDDAESHFLARESDGDPGEYGVSIFGMKVLEGEDLQDLKKRLCARVAAVPRKSTWATFTTMRRLVDDLGFTVKPSPPPDHFDIILDDPLDAAQIVRLEAVFNENKREKFLQWAA